MPRVRSPGLRTAKPMIGMLRDLWSFRAFVTGSIRRDIMAQYRGSLLGAVWVLIGPLTMISIYTVVFSRLMTARLPGVDSAFGYSVYLCAGLLPWTFFAEAISRLQNVFVSNGNLLKKASFPRICLPAIAFGTALFNFVITAALFVAFLLAVGAFPGPVALAVLPALLVQIGLTLGLGMLLATLNVFFRDVGQGMAVTIQFWFWLTPIVYPISTLPPWAQAGLQWNPMTVLVHHYQTVLLHQRVPGIADWWALLPVTLLAATLLWFGLATYRQRAGEMADEL